MDPEEVELDPRKGVEHPRVALRGADAADHGRRGVRVPVDRAVGLPDHRTRAAGDARVAVVDRLGRPTTGGDRRHGLR